jgi:predicted 3-demethylubiquinone-9 3-methyltransferase (glyoxalase superfamily)
MVMKSWPAAPAGGLSGRIIPSALPKLLGDPDRDKANRVMQAMLKMVKIDVAKLEEAARG